jgi:glucose/arabinose dehydrogenase
MVYSFSTRTPRRLPAHASGYGARMSTVRKPLRILVLAIVLTLSIAACGSGMAAHLNKSTSTESTSKRPTPKGSTSKGSSSKVPGVHLVRVGNFSQPVYITGAPRDPGRVFVVQRTGQVMLLLNGHKQARPFLDISSVVYSQGGEEQGLLGLAFPPDYAHSGLFYVDYTVPGNDIEIVQYRRSARDPDLADPSSGRVVLKIDHHKNTNHNGGQLAFGPEGDLYIGVGDGGSEDDPEANGQNADTLLGKILRIDPSLGGGNTIPHTNPYVCQRGQRAEIWDYVLSHPRRFSFDRATGDLIIGDVGQDTEEELDFAPAGSGAGANYGWSIWEGARRNKPGVAPHAVRPVLTAVHSDGYCALIGGYVVRDRSLPGLYGRYLFGDFCRPQIESVSLDNGHSKSLRATGLNVSSTSAFGEDAAGHIFLTSLKGAVYRLVGRASS